MNNFFNTGEELEFSYIITFRKTTEKRLENLKSVLSWLNSHKKDRKFEIIIVEQDEQKKVNFEDCKNIFIYNKGIYNKSWALNIGAINSSSEILVFGDSDILMKWSDFGSALDNVKSCWEAINPKGTIEYLKVSSFNPDIEQERELGTTTRANFSGGIVFFKKKSFFDLLGWPEEFEGWGAEDSAMNCKIVKILQKFKTMKFPIFHLYHEGCRYNQNPNFDNNINFFNKMRNMSKEELLSYYKDKKIGDVNKYSI